MPSRAFSMSSSRRRNGDHAGAIERYYTEDASMQENAARRGSAATCWSRMSAAFWRDEVYSKAMSSVVEGDRVAIHWVFELTVIRQGTRR